MLLDKNHINLLKTQVSYSNLVYWSNSVWATEVLSNSEFQLNVLRGPNASVEIFYHIVDMDILLAERILVRVLGLTWWILGSYLHVLCEHKIQIFYRGGRGLKI
jgi:hypothetical protein